MEEACVYLQKCSGLLAGSQAAIHAMQEMYNVEGTECIFLVNAKNASNNLNLEADLHTVHYICPALATCLQNCYQFPSCLFVAGGGS